MAAADGMYLRGMLGSRHWRYPHVCSSSGFHNNQVVVGDVGERERCLDMVSYRGFFDGVSWGTLALVQISNIVGAWGCLTKDHR